MLIESVAQDFRFAARWLRRRPGFTAAALVALALGIGANLAVFALIEGIVLRPLAFAQPERLLVFWGEGSWSKAEVVYLREQTTSYRELGAYADFGVTMKLGGEPSVVRAAGATGNLFRLLGVDPEHGRVFGSEEAVPGKHRSVVLSDRLWRRAFGADPAAVGRDVEIDGERYAVLGVMPPSFRFPTDDVELWVPLDMSPASGNYERAFYLTVIGRLRDGVSATQAQAEIGPLSERLAVHFDHPPGFDKMAEVPAVVALAEQRIGDIRPRLMILLAAVGFVLLIACANVANLLLAQGAARRRELAVRAALGSGRGRLVRQLLSESLLLALAGGALGTLLASWALGPLLTLLPADTPRLEEVHLAPTTLLFAFGLSLLAGLVLGLLPARQAVRGPSAGSLRGGFDADADPAAGTRPSSVLVVAEVALALVLVSAAALTVKSFWQLVRVDPGFRAENVLTAVIQLDGPAYVKGARRAETFARIVDEVAALPAVRAAGTIQALAIGDGASMEQFPRIEGYEAAPDETTTGVFYRVIAGDYFGAMGVPLRAGRLLDDGDRADTEAVGVVNEALVRRFFPDGDAIGRRMTASPDHGEWVRIVGVVGDVHLAGLDQPPEPVLYRPYLQRPLWGIKTLVARTEGAPMAALTGVREAVGRVDPGLPLARVRTMREVIAASLAQPRLLLAALGFFAACALLLGALGVYGVLAYAVHRRRREIGIRMTLGADRRRILALVLGRGLRLTALGTALGLLAALGAGRVLAGLLYGLQPVDLGVLAAVVVILGSVSFAACYLPARRATRVDPAVAIRAD